MTIELRVRRAAIVGGNGAVGQLLGKALAATVGPCITHIDRRMTGPGPPGARFIKEDIRKPSETALEAIASSDLVVLATPEDVAVDALPLLIPALSAAALLVDTLSVKSRFAQQLAGCSVACELLGINPMFAPDLGLEGRSIIVVPYRLGPRGAQFLRLIAQWGATAVTMNVEQHDRSCAALQVATHAAVLSFALALKASDYDLRAMEAIMPPPHRTLLALAGRILAGDAAVYREIQAANPYAAEMRAHLLAAQRSLDASVAAGSEDFAGKIEGVRAMLSRGSVDYAALCARLFAIE